MGGVHRNDSSGETLKMDSPILVARCLIAALAIVAAPKAFASDLRIGSMCQAAWGDGYMKPMPPERTEKQRALAEKGDPQAQYFMGVVTEEKEESNRWLQKAIANGSKGAAAYYAYRRDPRLEYFNNPARWDEDPDETHRCWWPRSGLGEADQTEILGTIIAAAEAGEPQPATWLWQMVTGGTRLGSFLVNCKVTHPLLNSSDAPKWAEIAARGGNPWAQEKLCSAYTGATMPQRVHAPKVEWGFQANPAKAFQWCSIAAQNNCARGANLHLAKLYEMGIGVEKSPALASYWRQRWNVVSPPNYGITSVNRPVCSSEQ